MPALTINQAQSGDTVFREYVQSGSWQCPKGGAHRWVHMDGDAWMCLKCGMAREFNVPEYAWNDKMDLDMLWGVAGAFDTLQRSLV